MPVPVLLETKLDERSATSASDKLLRRFTDVGRDAGQAMNKGLTGGLEDSERAFRKVENTAKDSYDKMRDAAGKLRAEEERLKKLREDGASNDRIVRQAEATERARRAESRAVRDAANAYDEYERAAQSAGSAGETAGDNFISGLSAGLADTRVGGIVTKLGGLGLAGGAAMGAGVVTAFAAATVGLYAAMDAGLASLQGKDLIRARLGVDPATMVGYGKAAADAYANGWGASIQDNLSTLQFGKQAGLVGPDAGTGDLQNLIEQSTTVSTLIGEDTQRVAQGTRNFIKTGLVDSYQEAFDLITAASQQGLDISGDLLDTAEEYGTVLHAVGLTGADSFGLIKQMMDGGIRNTDVAADSIKELSISVADNSELTRQAFQAMGFNADDMSNRFVQGGAVARDAFGEVLKAINDLDPALQQQVGLALFKTKWEDAKTAIKEADLSGAATELGNIDGASKNAADAVGEHANQWDNLGRKIDEAKSKAQEWLADTALGKFFTQDLPKALMPHPDAFGGPAPGGPAPNPSALNPMLLPGIDPNSIARPPGAPAIPGAGPGLLAPDNPLAPWLGSILPAPGTAPAPDSGPVRGPVDSNAFDEKAKAAGAPSLPDAPVLPLSYTQLGAGTPTAIVSAQSRADEAAHDLAEKKARVQQLEATNVGTAEDIQKARNAVTESERNQLQAEQSLQDAKTRAFDKQAKQTTAQATEMGQIGAQIDKDFGISKGLSGIAENITKFVANLAAAPLLGQLDAITKANPSQGGYGALGIAAAQGAFGPDYTGIAPQAAQSSSYAGYSGGGAGYSGRYSAGGAGPAALASTAGGAAYAGVPLGSNMDVTSQPGLDLLRSMGLRGATYASHTTDGASTDREIDVTDPAGGYGSGAMTQFAEFARQNPSLFEEFIYSDPTTGQKTGIRSGELVGPGTSQPGYYANNWGGHQDHAHIEPSKGGGLGFGDAGGGAGTGQGAGAFGRGGPPMSAPFGQNATRIGGVEPVNGVGKGGIGIDGGGAIGMGLQAGGMALDMMAPGAGQAAQMGAKLINRTIEYGGQAVGIGVQGAIDTFLPTGGSKLASNNWLTRIAGGIAGAGAAIPNMAGKSSQPGAEEKGPVSPEQAAANQQQNPQNVNSGNTQNINVTADDKRTGAGLGSDIAWHGAQGNAAPGMG